MKFLNALKYISAIILFAIAPCRAVAQIDAQFSQYWAVPGYYNAAAIGNSDYINVHAASRLQWVGIPKAPMTFAALGDMPFKFLGKRFATGLVISQESMGLYSSINAAAQLAFKKKIFKGELGIGVQVGFLSETFKGSEVVLPGDDDFHEGTDDGVPTTDLTGSAFDVSAGIFFQHKYFWVGVSGTHLTQPTVNLSTDSNQDQLYQFQAGRIFYFMGGSNIQLKNTLFELQPSVLVKTDTQYFMAEATLRTRYKKFLSGGVGYRWKDAVSVMIGADYKNFTLGYCYDYPLSKISKGSSGSHEVFIGYKVKLNLGDKNKNKHKSIRIM